MTSAPAGDQNQATPSGKRVLASMRWSIIGRFAQQGLRLGSAIVLAWFLTRDDMGMVAMAMVVIGFLDIFVDLGTGYAVVQREKVTDGLLSSVFFLNVTIGLGVTAAMYWLSPLVALAFDEPRITPLLQLLSTLFLITSLGVVHQSLLMREMQFDVLTRVAVAGRFVEAVVAITLAWLGHGVWSLAWGSIACAAIATPLLMRAAHWRPRLTFSRQDLRSIWGFSWNLAANNIYQYFATQADRVIIGRLLGTAPLGLYSMSQRLTTTSIQPLTAALDPVFVSYMSRVQGDNTALRDVVLRSVSGAAVLFLPMMAGLAIVAYPLTYTLFSAEWYGTAPLVLVLALVAGISGVVDRVNPVYTAKGRSDLMFRWGVVKGILLVIGFVIGAFLGGLHGVAIAYLATTVLLVLPNVLIPAQLIELKFGEFVRCLLPAVVATLVMAAGAGGVQALLTLALDAPTSLALIATIGAGVACYVPLILWMRPSGVADILKGIRGR